MQVPILHGLVVLLLGAAYCAVTVSLHAPVKLTEIAVTLTETPVKLTDIPIKLTEIPIKLTYIPVNLTDKTMNLAGVIYRFHRLSAQKKSAWDVYSDRFLVREMYLVTGL